MATVTAPEALYGPTGPSNILGNDRRAEATKLRWGDLSEATQKSILKSSKELVPGTPEHNKFDETLYEHGSIILPNAEGLDKSWNEMPSDVMRYDLPDGRVILRVQKQPEATS